MTTWPPLQTRPKTTVARLDYGFDWSAWKPAGATITGAVFTITGDAGLTLDGSTVVDDVAVAWLVGGTDGATPLLECEVTAIGGGQTYVEKRSMLIAVVLTRGTP